MPRLLRHGRTLPRLTAPQHDGLSRSENRRRGARWAQPLPPSPSTVPSGGGWRRSSPVWRGPSPPALEERREVPHHPVRGCGQRRGAAGWWRQAAAGGGSPFASCSLSTATAGGGAPAGGGIWQRWVEAAWLLREADHWPAPRHGSLGGRGPGLLCWRGPSGPGIRHLPRGLPPCRGGCDTPGDPRHVAPVAEEQSYDSVDALAPLQAQQPSCEPPASQWRRCDPAFKPVVTGVIRSPAAPAPAEWP